MNPLAFLQVAALVCGVACVDPQGTDAPQSARPAQHQGHAEKPPAEDLPPYIPKLTDDDRRAAFPDVHGHTVHDRAVHYYVLLDQLEWQHGGDGSGFNVDTEGWIGGDRDRLWFRAEGDREGGRTGEAQAQVFYGRQFSRWWDVVAGIRQDLRPGSPQTWAAVGIRGLAPYWFAIDATAYVGAAGRAHVRGEVEYELLLSNRLVLQPLVEAEISGTSDPERGVGAGLSTTDAGLRVRYEVRREFAPYVGVSWNRKYGKTARLANDAGESTSGARFVTGARLWF